MRSPTAAFAACYLGAWFSVALALMLAPAAMLQGFGAPGVTLAMRFIVLASLATSAAFSVGLGVLMWIRPPGEGVRFDDECVVLPRSWLWAWPKRVPIRDVATCSIGGSGPFRRVFVETRTGRLHGCAAWWFADPDGVEGVQRRIAQALESEHDGAAWARRRETTAELGRRSVSSWRGALLAIGFWVSIHLLQLALGLSNDSLPLVAAGGLAPWLVTNGEVTRIVSSAALHAHVTHLVVNVVVLWLIYPFVEPLLGRERGVIVFFVGVVSAGLAFASTTSTVAVGASGGIYGLIGAWVVLGLAHRARVGRPFAVPAYAVVVIVGGEIAAQGLLPRVYTTGHLAALAGGAGAAWLMCGRAGSLAIDRPVPGWTIATARACAAALVAIPAVALGWGSTVDLERVALRSIEAMRGRDLAAGAAVRPGFEVCFSPRSGLEDVERATRVIASVPAEGPDRPLWQALMGCMALRTGELETAWRWARASLSDDPPELGRIVLVHVSHAIAERGAGPVVSPVGSRPDVAPERGGLGIRFADAVPEPLTLHFALEQRGRMGILTTRVDRGVARHLVEDDARDCGAWSFDRAAVTLVAVEPTVAADRADEPVSRCAQLAPGDDPIRPLAAALTP